MPYEKEIQILSELRSEYSCFDPNEREYYHALSEAIRSLKTVDAVEVVRCKDCIYYHDDICKVQSNNDRGYCAWGERKEDAETN